MKISIYNSEPVMTSRRNSQVNICFQYPLSHLLHIREEHPLVPRISHILEGSDQLLEHLELVHVFKYEGIPLEFHRVEFGKLF